MNLTLIDDWKQVLAKAWSVRFSMLAAALGVLEMVFPLISTQVIPAGTVPQGAFALAGILLNVIIIPLVRTLQQKEMNDAIASPNQIAK